ncbi:extracellular calcium-sensing receptor-like [Mixophyes fleayi]|uniref:extracellular calcium-sensing receptor-like n=1 Tax=Mixophyes fleayi TaxID=3061075 RepID=UPI003F4DDA13
MGYLAAGRRNVADGVFDSREGDGSSSTVHSNIIDHSNAYICRKPDVSPLHICGGLHMRMLGPDLLEIGAIRFSLDYYQQLQALIFTVQEINRNPYILPNVTLGFHVYDTCNVPHYESQGTLQFLTESSRAIPNYQCPSQQHVALIVGSVLSSNSIILANILGVYKYPQISSLSSVSILSDRSRYPSFFRTVASDKFQSKGLAKLVLHFGWTWVGLLATDNDYGQQGIQPIRQELIKSGVCVAFTEYIRLGQPDRNAPHIAKVIKESTVKVIIVFSIGVDLVPIVAKALEDMKTDKIGEGTFSTEFHWNYTQWQLVPYIKKVRLTLSSGNKNYFDENGDPPALYSIVNWQLSPEGKMTQIKVGNYNGGASQDQALQINSSMLLFASGDHQVPRSVCSESCPLGFRKAAIKGQPICCFECVQCLQGEISNQTDSINCLTCPWDQWPNVEKSSCLPKPTEYFSFEDPLGITLVTISIMSSFIPVFILKLFIQYKQSPIVKANNYSLSCLLLLSLPSCFLCSLVFIGYPQPEKCLLRQVTFGMSFALCVSCILSKTIMVVVAFTATRPGSRLRRWTTPRISYMIIFYCLLLQLILCITWLSTFPPFPQFNIQSKPGFIIVECNEGSLTAFWTMLGYLFLLATISLIVAFLARRLPDSFNEAQFITFSMLAFLSVWMSFIPASLSAQGQYTVAMEIFAILASSWALVICMFLPKCFIILLRPEINSRAYIMRKERKY